MIGLILARVSIQHAVFRCLTQRIIAYNVTIGSGPSLSLVLRGQPRAQTLARVSEGLGPLPFCVERRSVCVRSAGMTIPL